MEIKGQFEWTESGLELLQRIQNIINENGGIDKMAVLVSNELESHSYKKDVITLRTKIKKMYGRVYTKDIPSILGISDSYYRKLILDMGIVGTANSGTYKQRKKFFDDSILD